jgi:hypothetical protein
MIVARNVFHLKFGKMKEAKELWKTGMEIQRKNSMMLPTRLLTDVTGRYYTLVLEVSAESMGDFEKQYAPLSQSKEWQDWYAKFSELVHDGYREILQEVK